MQKKGSFVKREDFQTPIKSSKDDQNSSPYRIFEFSENRSKEISKTKIGKLIKKIAQLQLRQGKYVQKIKYLQTCNIRLSRQKNEQLNLYTINDFQNIIKTYQQEISKLSSEKQKAYKINDSSNNQSMNKHLLEISKQKQNWIKKYEDLLEKSTKVIEQQKSKKLQYQYQNKYLKSKLQQLQIRIQRNEKVQKSLPPPLQRISDNRQKQHLGRIDNLERENSELRKRNNDLQNQFIKLQGEISQKFNFLEEQISLYENQKEQNLQKIKNLKQELSLRQSHHYFSFSNQKNQDTNDMQMQTQNNTHNQYQMDLNCFKSSIESLLEENARLKKTLTIIQTFHQSNNTVLPKQIQIQFQLNKTLIL